MCKTDDSECSSIFQVSSLVITYQRIIVCLRVFSCCYCYVLLRVVRVMSVISTLLLLLLLCFTACCTCDVRNIYASASMRRCCAY